jgi:sigma-B regulation protein RsbU (phosphoserine phosphatase)
MESSVYTPACPRRVALAQGDVVVLYTDGLVGARRGREEYGPERLLRGLEAHAGLPAPELGEKLLSDLEGFLGDDSPADDVTLIVVKML